MEVVADHIVIFFNDGNRTFIELKTYSTGLGPELVTTADVNNDNYPDIIIGYRTTDVGVHINDGNGNFSSQVDFYHDV